MSSKLSVLPTIRAHYDTFRDNTSGSPHVWDYIIFVGLPVAAGIACAWRGVRLSDVSGFLAGLAVFAALLFGLVVFVFQLRLQLRTSGTPSTSTLARFVDQLFYNVNYAVVVGIGTTGVATIAVHLANKNSAPVWISAMMTALALHLAFTILMCVKRVHAAYRMLTT
ncbi:hypothetical protein [Nocardia cyriacigeorgica]|uniref:hypothetical protein n=1 Tax=Nocardia cyriacigeorgica TaxID=135487 RepID=UPI0024560BFA|nr:hypothetical protein [Nocardia cyriacigeorgica]